MADDSEKESKWVHHKEDENETVRAQSVYVQGYKIGKNLSSGGIGIMFYVTGENAGPRKDNPIAELPVICFDEEGLLLLYNAIGRQLGLKGN